MPNEPSASNISSTERTLYVAASCDPQAGRGAWGLYSPHDTKPLSDSGFRRETTVNQLGLMAVAQTLSRATGSSHLVFVSENAYLVDNFGDRLNAWAEQGWKGADGKSVKNAAQWQAIHAAQQRRTFTIRRPTDPEMVMIEQAKKLAQRCARKHAARAA